MVLKNVKTTEIREEVGIIPTSLMPVLKSRIHYKLIVSTVSVIPPDFTDFPDQKNSGVELLIKR